MNSPEASALDLVAKGAILKTLEPASRHFLVGDLRWLAADAFFWFTAHGDCTDDGHVLAFDRAIGGVDGRLTFELRQQPIAVLSTIDCAGVSDADDYRIAFSFWKETGPLVRPLIDRCFDRCACDGTNVGLPSTFAPFTAVIAS